jgi:hypothetical protein
MSEKINVLIGANIEGLKTALAESGKSLSDFGTIAEQAPKRAKTAVDELNKSYRDAVRDAKNLYLMQGKTSEAFYEAELKAKNLKGQIQQLNEVVGQTGQMASGSGGVQQAAHKFDMLGHSVNQLTRELPAFTHSMSTGFMAISNNIPMFVDQLNNIRAANAGLIAQGQPVQSVFSQLASSIFSWQTALSLGVTILTVYGEKIYNYIAGIKDTKAELDKLAQSQKEINDLRDKYLFTEEEIALRNEAADYKKVVEAIKSQVTAYEGMQDVQNLTLENAKEYRETKARVNKELETAERDHLQNIADIREKYLEGVKKDKEWEVAIFNEKLNEMLERLAKFKETYLILSKLPGPADSESRNWEIPEGLREKEEEALPLFPSKLAMVKRAHQHEEFLKKMEKDALEHANRMKAINSILASSFVMIGQAIGDAFATGDWGGSALKLLAQFMALVGNAAIAVGMAYAAMGFTAGQGAIAIGAGIALIAASRVVGAKAGGGGGGNTSTSSSSSGGQSNNGSIPSFNPSGMMISIDGIVRGNNIVVALDNQTRMNRRVR